MTHFDGEKLTKKTSLRNNEYYSTQEIFDKLYKESKANKKFKKLSKNLLTKASGCDIIRKSPEQRRRSKKDRSLKIEQQCTKKDSENSFEFTKALK